MTAATLALLLATLPAPDTLRLPELQDAALARDPRAAQLALQEAAAGLRLGNLGAQRLPQLALRGEGTRQSDVTTIPIRLPGVQAPEPPRSRYQAALNVDQLVYDGGAIGRRREVERARLAEEQAGVRAALFALREEVTEAFFAAFLLQERQAEVGALIEDLEARLATVRSGVRAGAALPGDTAAVQAELLRARQLRAEAAADRRAALAVLAELTGRPAGEGDVLALPALGGAVARVRAAGGAAGVRDRPEYARFERTRERLRREAGVVAARTRPQVQAFGQLGLGRPGPFLLFDDGVNDFWMVGIRAQWQPWTWGTDRRERELLRVQQQVAATEEAAFTARLERQVQDELAAMERLEAALESDERIITLREQVERQARRQFEERVITADQYVDVRTDVFEARLARQRHRVELARARARYLTTLGVELR
ncbi:MAG TPA: TolC family protein [Longimicrobium sp.]|jgi:outer membrane protein TolC